MAQSSPAQPKALAWALAPPSGTRCNFRGANSLGRRWRWYVADAWIHPGDGSEHKVAFLCFSPALSLPLLPRGGWGTGEDSCQVKMPLQNPLPPEGFGDLRSKDSQRNWCPCMPSVGWSSHLAAVPGLPPPPPAQSQEILLPFP